MGQLLRFRKKLMARLDSLMWRIPFMRLSRKLLSIQIVSNGQHITFSELDRVACKLWRGEESLYMPLETKKLLFETKTASLSEADRYIKLRYVMARARLILSMSEMLVRVCDDSQISPYTGWEKDELEKLIDQAEHPNPINRSLAVGKLIHHPRLSEFLSLSASNNRGELVSRALSILVRGK